VKYCAKGAKIKDQGSEKNGGVRFVVSHPSLEKSEAGGTTEVVP
jgi:hypothetical protein